jgi:hypothetical protein
MAAKPTWEQENDKHKHYNEEAVLGHHRSSGDPSKEVLFSFIIFRFFEFVYLDSARLRLSNIYSLRLEI